MVKETDKHGNSIYDVKLKSGTQYRLHLSSEHYPRVLGVLNGNEFVVKRDRGRHLLDKAKSYGFNEHLLRNILTPDVKIIVKEAGRRKRLETTVADILGNGKYLFFLQQGFEKQLFLPLSMFK